jgi:hypothetical protein
MSPHVSARGAIIRRYISNLILLIYASYMDPYIVLIFVCYNTLAFANQIPTYTIKNQEKIVTKEILANNNYPQQTMYQKQKPQKPRVEQKGKWVTFTYFGPQTRTITKLFKNTDVGVSFRTKSNIKPVENKKKYH